MTTITFLQNGKKGEVPSGLSILEAAAYLKVRLDHVCGGNASCSTCRVTVLKGADSLSPIETAESHLLESFSLEPPYRLGCQALLGNKEVMVEIPKRPKPCRPSKIRPLPDEKQ